MDSDPLKPFDPDQAPDAEHDVELDEDQVSVTEFPTSISEADEVKVTCGIGVTVTGFSPPPPPPHETNNKLITNKVIDLKYMPRHIICFHNKRRHPISPLPNSTVQIRVANARQS